jgi:hypothetical protein
MNERESLYQMLKGKSTEELLTMVNEDAADYRDDALELARVELRRRGVSWRDEQLEAESAAEQVAEVEKGRESTCRECGSPVRYASLLAEKEIVLSFHDNFEQRFMEVLVCRNCGKVTFKVDFDTEVQG